MREINKRRTYFIFFVVLILALLFKILNTVFLPGFEEASFDSLEEPVRNLIFSQITNWIILLFSTLIIVAFIIDKIVSKQFS